MNMRFSNHGTLSGNINVADNMRDVYNGPVAISQAPRTPSSGRSTQQPVPSNQPTERHPSPPIPTEPPVAQERPLRLLCLDGGGVKGLASLLILKRIFTEIRNQSKATDIPNPCDYFDLIGGTSTGGLIAIMLGRLRMSIDDSENAFRRLSEIVFTPGWTKPSILRALNAVVGNPWFNGEILEEAVKDLLDKRQMNKEESMKESADPACKVFVGVTRTYSIQPELLRSYEIHHASEQNYKCTIWEAARATTAAPLFFKKISLGSGGATFVDGAIRRNNPIYELVQEAERLYPSRKIGCIVSIGTGWSKQTSIHGSKLHNIAEACVQIALDAEGRAEDFVKDKRGKELRKDHKYFRFNVEQGMHDVEIEEWKKMEAMDAMTTKYLSQEQTADQIESCVRALLVNAIS